MIRTNNIRNIKIFVIILDVLFSGSGGIFKKKVFQKQQKKYIFFLSNTIACNFYASIKYMLLRQCMRVTAGKKDKSWANRVLHLFCFLGLMFDHVAGSNAGRYKYSWKFDQ